jgi:cytochrome b involved in lipid metabolism
MSHKILIGTALIAAAVLGFAWFGLQSTPPVPNTPNPTSFTVSSSTGQIITTAASSTPAQTSFTLADVAAHGNASSCWSAINGKVYNLTSWISQHPGGPEHILSICGTDGSSAFNAQHGTQARPASELAGFYIGTLAQ